MLSASVSKGLVQVCGDDAMETAHLAEMMDKFFDALNVHNYNHGAKSRKSFQLPYTSGEDHRLKVNFYMNKQYSARLKKFSLHKVVRVRFPEVFGGLEDFCYAANWIFKSREKQNAAQ